MFSNQTILLGILTVVFLVSPIWLLINEFRLRRLFSGKHVSSLETIIMELVQTSHTHKDTLQNMEKYLAILDKKVAESVSGTGIVRFNAFKDIGGNQSFATALINRNGDGVVLSTLFGRERIALYAKPLIHFSSEYELLPEEKEAIQLARKNL